MTQNALDAPFWSDDSAAAPWGLTILVLYSVEPGSEKHRSWNDGFVAAVRLLHRWGHNVIWLNTAAHDADSAYDAIVTPKTVVLAKSNWGWKVDRFLRSATQRHLLRVPRAIMVSGISKRINRHRGGFYDVVFYQTEWYRRRLSPRLTTVHAYGINTAEMYPPDSPVESEWDWLYVGALTPQRRPELLLTKPGRRLVIGELERSDPTLISRLEQGHVEILSYVPYPKLREFYWRARSVYVPAALDGGGERQVMEAVACGRPIEIEPDNPKLSEVLSRAGMWTETYYAHQLELGLYMARAGA